MVKPQPTRPTQAAPQSASAGCLDWGRIEARRCTTIGARVNTSTCTFSCIEISLKPARSRCQHALTR